MTFEEFVKEVSDKMPPQAAFDMIREARIDSMQRLLIEKKIATKAEIDKILGSMLTDMAKKVKTMPPPPNAPGMNPRGR